MLFSFKARNTPSPSVWQFDEIPEKLRVQILHIITESYNIVSSAYRHNVDLYQKIHRDAAAELGRLVLMPETKSSRKPSFDGEQFAFEHLAEFLLEHDDVGDILSCLEYVMFHFNLKAGAQLTASMAQRMNHRFRQNGVGFQFELTSKHGHGVFVRLDSNILHNEITHEVMFLTLHPDLVDANREFVEAYSLFKNQKYAQCIVEATKALETALKIILIKRHGFEESSVKDDACGKLVSKLIKEDHVNPIIREYHTRLSSLMHSVINPRNKSGGAHGGGMSPEVYDEHLASLILNLSGSLIIYIEKCG